MPPDHPVRNSNRSYSLRYTSRRTGVLILFEMRYLTSERVYNQAITSSCILPLLLAIELQEGGKRAGLPGGAPPPFFPPACGIHHALASIYLGVHLEISPLPG